MQQLTNDHAKKNGSSLIMVLCVITVLTMLITSVWRSTMFTLDLALQRVHYEQQIWAAEGIRMYGIAIAQEKFAQFLKDGRESIVAINDWPSVIYTEYQGALIMTPHNSSIALVSQLKRNKDVVMAVQCQCTAVETTKEDGTIEGLAISEWSTVDDAAMRAVL